jgi:hypothetical protein
MTRRYTQHGLTVPYITAWTAEAMQTPRLEHRRGKYGEYMGYVDETDYDRDMHGTLWVRHTIARGRGRAQFETVHALRQRRCMLHLLCQVCAASTLDETPERQLYVLRDTGQPITEGELTSAPPLCLPCARTSVRDCPHLRTGHVAAWVDSPMAWGVSGITHDPQTLRPNLPSDRPTTHVPFDDPRARWTIASRHVVQLHGVTPVKLSDLDAAP